MCQVDDYPYESTIGKKKVHRLCPPGPGYDMNQLLKFASVDERSIEYEMGKAMFGTLLDHSEPTNSSHFKASNHKGNSLDLYERMRSELGVSPAHDDTSHSGDGYSSVGDGFMDAASLEGFDLDFVTRTHAVIYQQ